MVAEPGVLTGEEARGDDYQGVLVWMVFSGYWWAKLPHAQQYSRRVVQQRTLEVRYVLPFHYSSVLLASGDPRNCREVTRSAE